MKKINHKLIVGGLILLFIFSPLLLSIIGEVITGFDCGNEGHGFNHRLCGSFFYLFVTIPMGGTVFIVWLIGLLIASVNKKINKKTIKI